MITCDLPMISPPSPHHLSHPLSTISLILSHRLPFSSTISPTISHRLPFSQVRKHVREAGVPAGATADSWNDEQVPDLP